MAGRPKKGKAMRKSGIFATAATIAAFGGIVLGTAGQASAAVTPHPVTAITQLHNRPDGGGNGTWAKDNFKRTLTEHYLGKSTDPAHASAPYMYWAQVSDSGTFLDIPGAFTPDQGGSDLGKVLKPRQVSGPMSGTGTWGLFYASAKSHSSFVPRNLPASQNTNPAYASSTWPELAFPAGTTFVGVSENTYDYNYQAVPFTKYVVKIVHGKRTIVKVTGFRQHWEDANYNADGQLPRYDGNITGLR